MSDTPAFRFMAYGALPQKMGRDRRKRATGRKPLEARGGAQITFLKSKSHTLQQLCVSSASAFRRW